MSRPTSRDNSTTRDKTSSASSTGASTPTHSESASNSIETAFVSDKPADDSSKLKTFLSILRKFIGVSDIASVRFSLPAQLLEPTPNLEFWNYLDRPETFVAIPDSDSQLGRMLAVLRFWFTKDLKYVKNKPCKPYNSTLGEFFRCNWDVTDDLPIIYNEGDQTASAPQSESHEKPTRVSYLTEQTSHHPPISAFWIDCPEKGISARGFDQLSAKFTGTSIRVTAGAHNLGIFISVHSRNNEEYQLTHPSAHLGGLIRGSLYVSVADTCFVTCPQNKLKVVLHYMEEGWLGKSQNKVEGAIYRYDPENDNVTRLKDVPDKDVVARLEGCWHEKIYWRLPGSKEPTLLVDLTPLSQLPKSAPPLSSQLTNESQRFWAEVTTAIKEKRFTDATRLKQDLEARQRNKAAQRKEKAEEWRPRFFAQAVTDNGRPDLSEDGKSTLAGLQKGDFDLKEAEVTAA